MSRHAVPYRARDWRSSATPLLLLAAALGAALVLAVRLGSWSRCWRDAITEGREGPGLYALWRLLHGHALYERPLAEPYSLSLYNFGFYQAYARLLGLFGVDGEGLLLWPRLVTLAGAALGFALFMRVGARVARPSERLGWLGLASLAFVVWFGSQFVSWWAFAVRPDVWAAALALLGLELVLSGLERGTRVPLLLASVSFVAAWSFKQSTVWIFAGSGLALAALRRDVRSVLALALPFCALAGVTLALGGPEYRENVFRAPALGTLSFALLGDVLVRTIPQNLWVFGFGFAVLAWECRGGVLGAWRRSSLNERVLTVVALTALAFGTVACAREGSNKNHLLEAYVASALCSWCALRRASDGPAGVTLGGALAALPLVGLPALQLASALGLGEPNRFGRTVFCQVEDARAFTTLRAAVRALPQPMYAEDEVFGQPWHATSGGYPTLMLDATWYAIARRVGELPPSFPREVLERRGVKSALLAPGHPLVQLLEARGARCVPLAAAPLGLRYVACRLGP